ncbi:MAG: YiiD C-terminal domain-containing protein [Luteolibacter sp.]
MSESVISLFDESHDLPPAVSDDPFLREIENFLYEQIPITRAMGVQVAACDETGFVLIAPLEVNHNHLGTAFGGSLSAIATLAGYGLLWIQLEDRSAHIVIKNSSIRYHRPVRGAIRAICKTPDAATLTAFKTCFQKKGKARIPLQVTIEENDQVCVEFEGVYVAMR